MSDATAPELKLPAAPLPRWPAWLRARPELALTPLVLVLVLAVWQAVVSLGLVSQYVLPAPSNIGLALAQGISSGLFLHHGLVTLGEAAGGFAIAVSAGLIIGTLVAEVRLVERAVYPYLVMVQTMPKIALAPLLVVWFGFGSTSKVAVAAIISFFPMLVTTLAGMRATDQGRLDRILVGDCIAELAKLPDALPHIFSGLSIAVVFCMTGAIVGEFVGASAGLGYLIVQANARMNIPQVFAILLALGAIGVTGYALVQGLRRRLLFWEPKQELSRP